MQGLPALEADERPTVVFLYRLMNEQVPPGRIERLLREVLDTPGELGFDNESLALYAVMVAERLGAIRQQPVHAKRLRAVAGEDGRARP